MWQQFWTIKNVETQEQNMNFSMKLPPPSNWQKKLIIKFKIISEKKFHARTTKNSISIQQRSKTKQSKRCKTNCTVFKNFFYSFMQSLVSKLPFSSNVFTESKVALYCDTNVEFKFFEFSIQRQQDQYRNFSVPLLNSNHFLKRLQNWS